MDFENVKCGNEIEITNIRLYTKGDLTGYIEAYVSVDGYDLESLFRVYDPSNGPSLTLVSIDYGYLHTSIAEHWNEIETALSNIGQPYIGLLKG